MEFRITIEDYSSEGVYLPYMVIYFSYQPNGKCTRLHSQQAPHKESVPGSPFVEHRAIYHIPSRIPIIKKG